LAKTLQISQSQAQDESLLILFWQEAHLLVKEFHMRILSFVFYAILNIATSAHYELSIENQKYKAGSIVCLN
jgi:hypothetical protein